jgi:septation ring formation regulator EzrA
MELIKTITADDVNEAFDNLEKAFHELAKIEDKQAECIESMNNFKEGSKAEVAAKARLAKLQPEITEAQRSFRLAGLKADRVRLLLDVQKTSMGRD